MDLCLDTVVGEYYPRPRCGQVAARPSNFAIKRPRQSSKTAALIKHRLSANGCPPDAGYSGVNSGPR